MRIGIFSDLHGHNFREFSYIREDGINSRLYHQKEVMDDIGKYASENHIGAILFGGDLTHLKNNVDSQVVKIMMDSIDSLACVCPVYLLPGNHDYRLWGSEPALLDVADSLAGNIFVLQEGWFQIEKHHFELDIYAMPYIRKINERGKMLAEVTVKAEGLTLFFGHQDIIGVNYGGYVVEHGLDPDMLSKKFDYSFIGHCHDMMKIRDNVISIGSPLEHNFSDEGKAHGWWLFDTSAVEEHRLQFMENTGSPCFHTLQYGSEIKTKFVGKSEKDFYRIILDGVEMPEEVKAIKYKRIIQRPARESSKRTTISLSDSGKDIIEKYVDTRAGSLDKAKLIEIGRKYL